MSVEHMNISDLEHTIADLASIRKYVGRLGDDASLTLGMGIFPLLNTIDSAIGWMLKLDYECRNLRHYNDINEMELQKYEKLFSYDIETYSDKQLAGIKHFIRMIKIAEKQREENEG